MNKITSIIFIMAGILLALSANFVLGLLIIIGGIYKFNYATKI